MPFIAHPRRSPAAQKQWQETFDHFWQHNLRILLIREGKSEAEADQLKDLFQTAFNTGRIMGEDAVYPP